MRLIILFLIVLLIGLLLYPITNAYPFFMEIPFANWLGLEWQPESDSFGFGTAVLGSTYIVIVSLPIALVIGWFLALQLSDTRAPWLKKLVIPALETWVSLPSVVIGVWAISQLVPLVRAIEGTGYCLLTAAIGLSLFILPTVTLLFYRAYTQFQTEYAGLEKSFAMSAMERSAYFIKSCPHTFITTSVYSFFRLFGETMVVLMLSGNSVQIPGSLFEGVRSLTATIALEMAYASDMHETALYAMASFSIVLMMVILLIQRLGVKNA